MHQVPALNRYAYTDFYFTWTINVRDVQIRIHSQKAGTIFFLHLAPVSTAISTRRDGIFMHNFHSCFRLFIWKLKTLRIYFYYSIWVFSPCRHLNSRLPHESIDKLSALSPLSAAEIRPSKEMIILRLFKMSHEFVSVEISFPNTLQPRPDWFPVFLLLYK